MNGGGFHQCPEVLVDHLFLGVVRLRKAVQKHYHSGDVLIGLSELWRIVPPIHGVALDAMGATPGVACRFMHTEHSLGRKARWHSLV